MHIRYELYGRLPAQRNALEPRTMIPELKEDLGVRCNEIQRWEPDATGVKPKNV